MSTYAQRVQLGPFFSGGTLQGAAKLYHYEAGTSTLKNLWTDRGMTTTVAQPLVADSNGIFNFFADGIYKLIICGPNSTGPSSEVLYTLDNWQLLDPQADIQWSEGTVIASASSIAVGPEIWAHISGSVDIDTISGTIPFFWAVFDGTLTVNSSANIVTPNAVNLTVQSGDAVFFLNDGSGVWRVAGRSAQTLQPSADDVKILVQDGRTNTVDVPFTVRSTTTGTPAAGIGTGILYQAESGDETPSDVGQSEFVFSDVSAGSEDSFFQILLRVAGAALTACYRFVATGAFKAIFTHANSADRTYTLPNYDATLASLAGTETFTNKTLTSPTISSPTITGNTVGTGALKTSTGSATSSITGAPTITPVNTADPGNTTARLSSGGTDFTLNDYSFAPSVTWDGGGTQVVTVRWRYITASDNPVMWLAYDPVMGAVVSTWASDDPTPGDVPGVVVPGASVLRVTARDLESIAALSTKASEAQAYIQDRKMRMQHVAYRALQLLANDPAPARWLMQHLQVNTTTGRIEVRRG